MAPRDPNPSPPKPPRQQFRTVWISDVHLGTRNCQAELLLRFLKSFRAETLYLVGDIVDFWEFRRSGLYWPASHNKVLRRVLKIARQGTRVVYIPGNHDEPFREFVPINLGEIEVRREAMHETATGLRIWVMHGDDFDIVTKYHRWLALLGDRGYVLLLWLNRKFNRIRRSIGWGYWSLSAAVKHRVKKAVNFVSDFEHMVVTEARKRGVQAVLCGHIHHAEQRMIDGVLYLNSGDWVESCTAVVEHPDGALEVLHYARISHETPHETADDHDGEAADALT